MPDPFDHYRPIEGGHDPGVYRVVGVGEEVALLRVADADGRRVHTGELSHVSPATLRDAFEPADNPDGGFSPVRAITNGLEGLYWQIRRFF